MALEVGVERPLDKPPQLGAGVRVPGVRKQRRDVEVGASLRCWSGAFLWIWRLMRSKQWIFSHLVYG